MVIPEIDSSLRLLPEGGIFLTRSGTLVLADLHLGKSAAFRAKGVPVPEGDTSLDLGRVLKLVRRHEARRLIFAGDLFHAPAGVTPEIKSSVLRLMKDAAIPVILVVGNHDRKVSQFSGGPERVTTFEPEPGFKVVHDPEDAGSEGFHLTGHWHPLVKIRDGKRTALRLPCFLLRERTLVLPAFGSFTGGAIIGLKPGDRAFVTHREQVIELPEQLIHRSRR